jgi:hypothetical protein
VNVRVSARAVLMGLMVVWLLFLTWFVFRIQSPRIRALQAVSVGMPRQLVIEKLGPPKESAPSDVYVKGGESLTYHRFGSHIPEFYVILDKTGHVATIVYPFIEAPAGRR